jgi:hypothetical protein
MLEVVLRVVETGARRSQPLRSRSPTLQVTLDARDRSQAVSLTLESIVLSGPTPGARFESAFDHCRRFPAGGGAGPGMEGAILEYDRRRPG